MLDLVLNHYSNNVNRRLLLPSKHVIWLDNLFITLSLLKRLCKDSIRVASIVCTSKTPQEIYKDSTYKTSSQPSSQLSSLLLTPLSL